MFGTPTDNYITNAISISTGGVVMNMQHEDISAGLVIWPVISLITTSLAAVSG